MKNSQNKKNRPVQKTDKKKKILPLLIFTFILPVLSLLPTGCLSTGNSKTVTVDPEKIEYKNPLLESEKIKEKTRNDIPQPHDETKDIADLELPQSPLSSYPEDIPTPAQPQKDNQPVYSRGQSAGTTASASPANNTGTGNTPAKGNSGVPTSPASANPSAASGLSSTDEKRDVIAEVRGGGSPVEIDLPGKGWAYRQSAEEKRPINYIGKENTLKGSKFRFSLPEEGSYLLTFVQQNNKTGKIKAYDVRVIIGSGESGQSAIEIPGDEGDENNKNQQPNLSPAELIQKAISTRNYTELDRLLNLYINDPSIPLRLFNDSYQSLKESGSFEKMRLLLLYKLEKNGKDDPLGMAYYYYEMATTYEQPGRFRDIKRAYNLYKKVYDDYPISVYSGKSKKRMEYLERHFLKVY